MIESTYLEEPFERTSSDDQKGQPADRRAIEMVRRFMIRSDKYRKPHLEFARRARDLYECWNSVGRSLTARANLRLPYAYLIIESELPALCEIFLKEEPFIKFSGRTQQAMQWEDALADFTSMQLDQMEFIPKFYSFTKAMLIDGTGFAKIPYKYKEVFTTRRRMVQEPLLGISYPVKEPALEVLFDGPNMEQVAIEDIFPDWSVKSPGDIQSMRGIVHRIRKTINEVKQLRKRKGKDGQSVGMYDNTDELEKSIGAKGPSAWNAPYWSSDYSANGWYDKNNNEPGVKDQAKLELWEYWGAYDPKNDGVFEEYVITVANGDVLLRCEPNFYDFKFKPFVACPNVPRDGEFYGISELLATKGLIKEATALRNSRLDQVNLAVNRMWLVDRAAGLNAKTIYSRPNGIVYINDINGIKPLDPPEVPASAYREIQEINNEIQTITANPSGPSLSEAGKTFGRSATGAKLVSNIASSRIGVKARLMSSLFFRHLARIMLMTNRQFVSETQWVRTSDPNSPNPFSQLDPSAFQSEYDFEIGTDLEIDSGEMLAKMQQFVQIAQVAEQSQPGRIKFDVVFEEIGRDLLGRRIKKFTNSDDQMHQIQMQKLAAEQAANASVGQRAPQPNAQPQGAPQMMPPQGMPGNVPVQ